MKTLVLALAMLAYAIAPAIGQDVIFEDDFEEDSGLWFTGFMIPGEPFPTQYHRVVDPLDPTNHVLSPPAVPWAPPAPDVFSALVPLDLSSTYVLSFRFLDQSPEVQTGSVAFVTGATVAKSYQVPLQLMADGTWHEYSFEFTALDLFDPASGSVAIALSGPDDCGPNYGEPCYETPETYNYYDDIRIERTAAVSNDSASWGAVKALFSWHD